ncbi:MAG: paeninodin family lasso peptide [Candidatus Pristimantibacillus sp.]
MKKEWQTPALETLDVKMTFDGDVETAGRPKHSGRPHNS